MTKKYHPLGAHLTKNLHRVQILPELWPECNNFKKHNVCIFISFAVNINSLFQFQYLEGT